MTSEHSSEMFCTGAFRGSVVVQGYWYDTAACGNVIWFMGMAGKLDSGDVQAQPEQPEILGADSKR